MATPFKYLQQNLHKVKFDCEPQYIPEYRQAFSRVLDRLDKYFRENKLYDCGDYQSYVEDMIKPNSKFSFKIDKSIEQYGWAGVHARELDGTRSIGITPEYIGNGLESEGVICHEFFHYLTLGPERLKYILNGNRVEVDISLYQNQSKKEVWEKGNNTPTPTTSFRMLSVEAMNGGFICEAMTELSKQQIYTKQESHYAYKPQTEMINFVSKMVGGEFSMREFLQGDLKGFASAMGSSFDTFYRKCETFQTKFCQNARIDYKNDRDYIDIQDTFVNSFLDSMALQTSNPKYSPSNVARILATLQTAPVSTSKYDSKISNLKAKVIMAKHLKPEQARKFRKLLDTTISERYLADHNMHSLPEGAPNIIFQQTDNGFNFSYNGCPYISSDKLPTKVGASQTIMMRRGEHTIATTIDLNEHGFYEITEKNRATGEVYTINMMIDAKNPSSVMISDKETGAKFNMNFARAQMLRDRKIQIHSNLLDNFQHYDAIQNLLQSKSDEKIFDVRKVKSNDGAEYLVASSAKNNAIFIKINGNQYEIVDVQSRVSTGTDIAISEKFRTAEGDRGMIGYNPTQTTTDEDSITYELSDGTKFVKYFQDGKMTYGEQIYPFSDKKQSTIITINNDGLYDVNDKSMQSIFEIPTTATADTSYSSQGIKRELPTRDLEAERKAREEQNRRLQEQKRRQEEINRRREEERKQQQIIEEEKKRRDRQIDQERVERERREREQKEQFERTQQKIRQKEPIYDEYGVDISGIHQFDDFNPQRKHTQGRSR